MCRQGNQFFHLYKKIILGQSFVLVVSFPKIYTVKFRVFLDLS